MMSVLKPVLLRSTDIQTHPLRQSAQSRVSSLLSTSRHQKNHRAMPPLPIAHMVMMLRAVLTFVTIGAAVMAGISVMDYSHSYYSESTKTPLSSLKNSLAVKWGPKYGSDSCPTCLFASPDDPRIEGQKHLDNMPTPTLPLKISYAAPSNLHPKPTPTPVTTPKVEMPRVSSTLGLASFPFSNLLILLLGVSNYAIVRTWWLKLSCYIADSVYIPSIIVSTANEHRIWRNVGVITFAVIWSICASTVVGFLLRRFGTRKNTRVKATLAKESPKMSRTADRIFNRLRDNHQDKLNAAYERGIFAAADVETSFGPSLQNAEFELRRCMNRFRMTENQRENIIEVFNQVLHSFTYALAVEESKPEGAHARYLSVIDSQNNLIECLRLLHLFREHAFKENEELVRLLCRQPEDNNFKFSPIDGPTALSMMVSVSSVPFDNRPDTILDSDPHWKKFVASIAGKRSEQEARLASEEADCIRDGVEEDYNVEDASALGVHDVSQRYNEEGPGKKGTKENCGIKDANEQNHHDFQTSDDATYSKEPAVEEMSRGKHTQLAKSSSPSPSVHQKAKGVHLAKNLQEDPGDYLVWLKWNVRFLTAGYGTPDDPDPKPYSDATPITPSSELTGDAAIARQYQEEEIARWRVDRIKVFELRVASLEASRGNKTVDNCSTNKATQPIPVATTEDTPGEKLSVLPQEEDLDLRKDEVGGKLANTHASEQDGKCSNDRPSSPQQERDGQEDPPFLHQSGRTNSTLSSDHPTKTNVPPTEDAGCDPYVKFLQQKSDSPAPFHSDFNWHPKQNNHNEASTGCSEKSPLGSDTPVAHTVATEKPNAPQKAIAEASSSNSPNTDEASNPQTQPEPLTPTQKRKRAKDKKANEAKTSH